MTKSSIDGSSPPGVQLVLTESPWDDQTHIQSPSPRPEAELKNKLPLVHILEGRILH
jgi:hypothetical protein